MQALPADAPQGSNAQKVGDYYRAFIDTAAIDAKGIVPARAGIDAISAARNHHDLDRLMGRADLRAARRHCAISTSASIRRIPTATPSSSARAGSGLPDRDYYLKPDAVYAQMREKYRAAHRRACSP